MVVSAIVKARCVRANVVARADSFACLFSDRIGSVVPPRATRPGSEGGRKVRQSTEVKEAMEATDARDVREVREERGVRDAREVRGAM